VAGSLFPMIRGMACRARYPAVSNLPANCSVPTGWAACPALMHGLTRSCRLFVGIAPMAL
jgi:hypothetical protein